MDGQRIQGHGYFPEAHHLPNAAWRVCYRKVSVWSGFVDGDDDDDNDNDENKNVNK